MQWKGKMLGILEMRRHYSNYLKGISHIKDFRNQLVQKNSFEEIDEILIEIESRYSSIVPERTGAILSEKQLQDCAY